MFKPCLRRFFALILAVSFVLLTGCETGRGQAPKIADFGPEAAEFAVRLAQTYPRREAGTAGEAGAAQMITEQFESLGYVPERREFPLPSGGVSQNIIVRIPGTGFTYASASGDGKLRYESNRSELGKNLERTVFVTAGYNTPNLTDEVINNGNFNGICDNASGVAALMMLAKQLKSYELGYDVVLAALGGFNQNYAGARALLNGLSEQERTETDCFYEIRNIYAGTKLYAHSGWASLAEGRKYEMRRRTYSMTDVAIEHGLIDAVGMDLYLNEGGYYVDSPLDGTRKVYREFTLTPSNYRVFDEASIPIVFFEAYDYDARNLEGVAETRSPDFAETGGRVAGTHFDNASFLSGILEEGRLEQRVNLMAFILAEGLLKEPPDTIRREAALK